MAHRSRDIEHRLASNRCRCGHFPVSHMRVTPVGAPTLGTSQLEPVGPCEICGAVVCPRFEPPG